MLFDDVQELCRTSSDNLGVMAHQHTLEYTLQKCAKAMHQVMYSCRDAIDIDRIVVEGPASEGQGGLCEEREMEFRLGLCLGLGKQKRKRAYSTRL